MAIIPFRPLRRSTIRPLSFPDEIAAKHHLETLLAPFFVLKAEVWCRHLLAGNRLRIDYVARPEPNVEFPFDWFGVEVKKSCDSGGEYNQALKQAIDYTFCRVVDKRPNLARIKDQRINYAFVFPARGDDDDRAGDSDQRAVHEAFWVNRLAGKFQVGMIYEIRDQPVFYISADCQWCPYYGPRKGKHSTKKLVGSGVERMAP